MSLFLLEWPSVFRKLDVVMCLGALAHAAQQTVVHPHVYAGFHHVPEFLFLLAVLHFAALALYETWMYFVGLGQIERALDDSTYGAEWERQLARVPSMFGTARRAMVVSWFLTVVVLLYHGPLPAIVVGWTYHVMRLGSMIALHFLLVYTVVHRKAD